MARGRTTGAASRLARLEERLAEARRVCAGDEGPVIAYANDDERAVEDYIARRERAGAELVVVVRSLATRPAERPAPWA